MDPQEEVEHFHQFSVSAPTMTHKDMPLYNILPQIDVFWKASVNTIPPLGDNCRNFSTTVPPPSPIQTINIVDVDTRRVISSLQEDALDVIVAVMLVVISLSNILMAKISYFLQGELDGARVDVYS